MRSMDEGTHVLIEIGGMTVRSTPRRGNRTFNRRRLHFEHARSWWRRDREEDFEVRQCLQPKQRRGIVSATDADAAAGASS